MGVVIEKWLLCDRCGSNSRGGGVVYKSIKRLREYCQYWVNEGKKDFCPDCVREMESEESNDR